MKCTDRELTRQERRMQIRRRQRRKALSFLLLLICLIVLIGFIVFYFLFRSHEISFTNPYDMSSQVYGVLETPQKGQRAEPFTKDLCVTAGDVAFEDENLQTAEAGTIMDLNTHEVLFAQNVHERLYPASLTKVMTALVAIRYGNLDDVITIDENALDIDPESSVCYLELGDQYTLKQLIYGMLLASGNDAANAIAWHVGGSLEGFVSLMNHFMNAHGLQDENHYTTPYDMYLIFNEAIKYSTFTDAINQQSYTVTYTAGDGEQYERTWFATNYYFTGEATPPDNVTVFGGKTGTTDEAGACLSLLTKDPYGNSYFSIIMKADTKDDLYSDMNDLLSIINKKQL